MQLPYKGYGQNHQCRVCENVRYRVAVEELVNIDSALNFVVGCGGVSVPEVADRAALEDRNKELAQGQDDRTWRYI